MKKFSPFALLLIAISLYAFIIGPNVGNSTIAASNNSIRICSFNIQFLGSPKVRQDKSLANILKDYDIVVVQELIAPPYGGTFPDGKPFKPDPESAEFFEAMKSVGFNFILSEEDTGPGKKNHLNTTATEWWVSFFKPEFIKIANDLPSGFLAEDRTDNADFERVPYAFAFRSIDGNLDFVLISVHLMPNGASEKKARRKHELKAIINWINDNDDEEKDFIVLGDMNIQNKNELMTVLPSGFTSLNGGCVPTNTNIKGPKPYDHIMYNKLYTTEIDENFGFKVVNLVIVMRQFWENISNFSYPGSPYNHDRFRRYYSDHNPVVFRTIIPESDDD